MSSAKRGGQDISLYMQSWVASNPVSRSSTYPTPFSLNGVSLLMVSAIRYALRTPYSAPIRSSFVNTYQGKLTVLLVTVSLCLSMSKHYFYPYQRPPTPYPCCFKLTGYEVKFLLVNYLLVQGAGKSFMGDSSSRHSFNARTCGAFSLAPLLDEGVPSSFAHFSSYI